MGDSYFVLFEEFISKHFGSVQSSVSTNKAKRMQFHYIYMYRLYSTYNRLLNCMQTNFLSHDFIINEVYLNSRWWRKTTMKITHFFALFLVFLSSNVISFRIWILNRDGLSVLKENLFMLWQWAKTNLNIMQVPVVHRQNTNYFVECKICKYWTINIRAKWILLNESIFASCLVSLTLAYIDHSIRGFFLSISSFK